MYAIHWVLPYVSKYKVRMIIAFIMDVVVTLLALVNPYVAGRIVADVLQGGQHELMISYLAIMIGNTLFRNILRYIQLIIFESSAQWVLFALRRDLYARVHQQTYLFFDENRVGDTMARMTGDLEAIRSFIAYDLYAIPESVLLFLSAIVMMFAISVPLALSMLLVSPVILITAYKQAKEIKPAFRNRREQFSRLNSVCEENIGGNRLVKAFAREDFEIEKFNEVNRAYGDSHIQAAKIWSKYLPVMDTCANLLPFFSLFLGSLLIVWGKMELWQLITFNGYLWMVNNPMRMFGMYVNNAQNLMTSLDKVFDMMRKKIHIYSPENGVNKEAEGAVEFSHVDFGYDRHNPQSLVLKDISFRAEKGWTVGIVGPTGAGKSTLAQLIGRYYDTLHGEVKVDGVNVRDYDLQTLRRSIAAAMQDVFLFSDTIEGNIAYGVPDIAVEAVLAAAEAADANGFVQQLPEGYDTVVGERGVGLSGGQKQRLSLARALAVDPAILILDDTTSAVDMETEQRIQAALKTLNERKLRTTFIIAHRLLSVKAADLILVLENGRITERGTHDTLMAKNGYYATLFKEQQGLSEGEGGETYGA